MKIALVCANGGHLVEMMQLKEAWENYEHFFITFQGQDTEDLKNAYRFRDWKSRIIKQLELLQGALRILPKERPDVIISTGGAIAIPFCYVGKMMGAKIIFIESFTRIKTKSGGGKAIYPIADEFLVQWPELLEKYGSKAKFKGRVV